MTTVNDILNFTETFAPLSSAADFDNCGVLVGSPAQKVEKVLLALDITNDVTEEAKAIGAQLIISHHPVIFNPLKSLDRDSVPYLLAESHISALCLHTNLDIAKSCGVNLCLAEALKLENIRLFPEDFLCLGELSEALGIKEFAEYVKGALNAEFVCCTKGANPIRTVAMCSGAGADYYRLAIEKGADVFITGEARHHEFIEADACGIPMITAGHFHTEDVVISPLKDKLSKEFPKVEFIKSETCRNPFFCV